MKYSIDNFLNHPVHFIEVFEPRTFLYFYYFIFSVFLNGLEKMHAFGNIFSFSESIMLFLKKSISQSTVLKKWEYLWKPNTCTLAWGTYTISTHVCAVFLTYIT